MATAAPTTSARRQRDDGFGQSSRFYDIEGKSYPSVTTILKAVNKPALVNWAAKLERQMVARAAADLYECIDPKAPKMSRVAFMNTLIGDGSARNPGRVGHVKAHSKELEKAADIGTAVHELIEWNMRRELQQAVGPEPKIPAEGVSSFVAYDDWRKSSNLSVSLVEQVVYSKRYGYAGTMDFAGEMDDPHGHGFGPLKRVHVVGDWKTGKGIWPEALLQNAALVHATIEMGHADPGTEGCIVRIPKSSQDPQFEVKFIPAERQKRLFKAFLSVFEVWKWLEEENQK